jgi:hypothetical protein
MFRNVVGLGLTGDDYLLGEECIPSTYIDTLASNLRTEVTQIFAGSMFGLENFFAKSSNMALDSIVVSRDFFLFLFA